MRPEASVVIPTCNRRAMVGEAIASVLSQEGASFELIVVDDGSTDGTFEELQRLAAARAGIRVARIAHRGPAAARNHGIALARAEFVALLDSDDLWLPGKLLRQLAYLRAHPQFPLAQTQELWLRDGRRINPAKRHLKRAGDIFLVSLRTCLISPSVVMIRTELLRALGGFDERMAACEDYDLWLRILLDHEVGLLDEVLAARRAGHRGQLSAVTPALDRFRIVALLKLLAADRLSAARRTATASVLAEKCAILARGLRRRERFAAAEFYAGLATRASGAWSQAPDDSLPAATSTAFEMIEAAGAEPAQPGGAKGLSPS